MPVVDANKLESFAADLLKAGGANKEEAAVVALSLVGANLRGYDSHGVMRIPFYIEMLQNREIVSGAKLTVLQDSPSHVVADGNWGFGRVQAGRLLDRLIDKAQTTGVGVGTLFHSSHIGRLGEYCELAASHQLLTMLMVNTHGTAARVAPPGGKAPRLGTNPLALGAPYRNGPLVLDFSTSATAEGKVRVQKIAGLPCPEGWLLDHQGQPTTDPNTLYGDPPGSILPMGGSQPYKGFGLALMIDIFAGALSGGLCARAVPLTPKGNCVFMLVLSAEHFGGLDHLRSEVEQLVEYVRECPRVDGVDRIYLPGDPERMVLEHREREGIPLEEQNWQQLVKLAEKFNVSI